MAGYHTEDNRAKGRSPAIAQGNAYSLLIIPPLFKAIASCSAIGRINGVKRAGPENLARSVRENSALRDFFQLPILTTLWLQKSQQIPSGKKSIPLSRISQESSIRIYYSPKERITGLTPPRRPRPNPTRYKSGIFTRPSFIDSKIPKVSKSSRTPNQPFS